MLLLLSQGFTESAKRDWSPKKAGGCKDNLDCQLNGRCIHGACLCDPAWGGADCGDLQLEVGEIVYGCYPTDPLQCDYSSWGGGPPVFDRAKNVWVMFQDRIAKHCGLSEWSSMSEIVRTVSHNGPAGPYVTDGSPVLQAPAHNAYYAYDPLTGKHLIYHIHSARAAARSSPLRSDCTNGTTPRTPGLSGELAKARADSSADVFCDEGRKGANCLPPVIHEAESLSGPWRRVALEGAYPPQFPGGNGGLDITGAKNPAPFIFENGTVLALYKKNQTIWAARAPRYTGPYEALGEIFFHTKRQQKQQGATRHVPQEDPTLWRDARGNFHALMHPLDGTQRGHGFSKDGINWHWADPIQRGRPAFHSSIRTPDGNVTSMGDAERLRVWVNPDTNQPELFFYASGGAHQPTAADGVQRSFTVVQRIRTTRERKGPDPTQIQISDQASEVRERKKATSSAGLDQAAEARRRWKENEAQQREKEASQREKGAKQKADNEKRQKENEANQNAANPSDRRVDDAHAGGSRRVVHALSPSEVLSKRQD